MDRAETRVFNRGFLPHWDGWHSRTEYAPGGTAGQADATVLVGRFLLPLEVKCGEELKSGLVRVHVRPAQMLWHRGLLVAGGISAFFIMSDRGRKWILPSPFLDRIVEGDLGKDHDLAVLPDLLQACFDLMRPKVLRNIRNSVLNVQHSVVGR